MSIKFPPAIPGPEMAVPILWAPSIFWFFLQERTPMPRKFLLLGGVLGFLGKGGVPGHQRDLPMQGIFCQLSVCLRIYPYPMVWPLPRPWSQSPSEHRKPLEIKGFLCLERPFLDLVSQTQHPRGRGRPLFAEIGCLFIAVNWCLLIAVNLVLIVC